MQSVRLDTIFTLTAVLAGTGVPASATVSVVNELGEAAIDATGAITDRAAESSATGASIDLTLITASNSTGYYRAYFKILDADGNILVLADDSDPVEFKVEPAVDDIGIEFITPGYLKEMFLKRFDAFDRLPCGTLRPNGVFTNAALRNYISSGTAILQRNLDMKLTPTTVTEKYDWDRSAGSIKWTLQLRHTPLRSLDGLSVELNYCNIVMIPASDWDEFIVGWDETGVIIFMPIPLNILTSLFPLVPNFFDLITRIEGGLHITYTHGFDWENLDEGMKDEIRYAIGRRAIIELIRVYNPKIGKGSESVGMDGVSESISYSLAQELAGIADAFKAEEVEWVANMKADYRGIYGSII
jgi:hypothetical protein